MYMRVMNLVRYSYKQIKATGEKTQTCRLQTPIPIYTCLSKMYANRNAFSNNKYYQHSLEVSVPLFRYLFNHSWSGNVLIKCYLLFTPGYR